MNVNQIGLLFSGLVALYVLFQLFNVLGRKVGRQPEDQAPVEAGRSDAAPAQPLPQNLFPGAGEFFAREPGFDLTRFLNGARGAFEQINNAFAEKNREALIPLVTPEVLRSFTDALDSSTQAPGKVEFAHPPRVDIESATILGDIARLRVRFLAEIIFSPKDGEPAPSRRTAEIWTFERRIGASSPNWTLGRVEPASA